MSPFAGLPNGSPESEFKVTLVVTGDKFYADYETQAGYTAVTAVPDRRNGKYC